MNTDERIRKGLGIVFVLIAFAGLFVAISSMSTTSDPGGISKTLGGLFVLAGLITLVVAGFLAAWLLSHSLSHAGWVGSALLVCCVLGVMIIPEYKQRQTRASVASYSRDYAKLTALVEQAHSDIRSAVDDEILAASVPQAHASRLNATDFEQIYPTPEDDYFLEQHAIFMFVIFNRVTPAYADTVGRSYVHAYCTRFHENFGDLVVGEAELDRAASLCPEHFQGL